MHKPGYRTTEFWLSLLAQGLPLLVLTGVLSPDQAGAVTTTGGEIIKAAAALLAAAAPATAYVWTRGRGKAAWAATATPPASLPVEGELKATAPRRGRPPLVTEGKTPQA